MSIKKVVMRKIRDATDNIGGAKFPVYMRDNMRKWEREGLIELHIVGADTPCARITDKGRRYADDN
jgi:hypothetical protein